MEVSLHRPRPGHNGREASFVPQGPKFRACIPGDLGDSSLIIRTLLDSRVLVLLRHPCPALLEGPQHYLPWTQVWGQPGVVGPKGVTSCSWAPQRVLVLSAVAELEDALELGAQGTGLLWYLCHEIEVRITRKEHTACRITESLLTVVLTALMPSVRVLVGWPATQSRGRSNGEIPQAK